MRLKSREFNAAFSFLVALGVTSGCGEDPVSSGAPGDFDFAGNTALPTGGAAPLATGGSTGGTKASTGGVSSPTGGTSFGTGGTKATGGSGGMTPTGGSGGRGGGATTGGKSGTGGTGGKGGGGFGGSTGGRAAGGSGGGGATVMFSQVGKIIETRCSPCHKATMPILQNTMMLRTTLTTFKAPDCGNPLVTPNDPSKSAIIQLVSKQCGATFMPLGCTTTPCIPAAEVTTITNWINAGAPP